MGLNIIECFDLNSTGLLPYRTLKKVTEHNANGIFVAEGEKVVVRLLESKIVVKSILITKKWLALHSSLIEHRQENIELYLANEELFSQIVGFDMHQGIMAVAEIPKQLSLPNLVHKDCNVFVALDGLVSAENSGVIVRNCVAGGADAIICGETTADPYLRRAVRNSMGNVFKIPVFKSPSLAETLRELQNIYSFKVVAAHPSKSSVSIYNTKFSKNICIVFGNEGNGVSSNILDVCNEHVIIPMTDGVDSFNVANSCAIFLYEIMRRKYCDGREYF